MLGKSHVCTITALQHVFDVRRTSLCPVRAIWRPHRCLIIRVLVARSMRRPHPPPKIPVGLSLSLTLFQSYHGPFTSKLDDARTSSRKLQRNRCQFRGWHDHHGNPRCRCVRHSIDLTTWVSTRRLHRGQNESECVYLACVPGVCPLVPLYVHTS